MKKKIKLIIKESYKVPDQVSEEEEIEQDNYYIEKISEAATEEMRNGLKNDFSHWDKRWADIVKESLKKVGDAALDDESFAKALQGEILDISNALLRHNRGVIPSEIRDWISPKEMRLSRHGIPILEGLNEYLEDGKDLVASETANQVFFVKNYGLIPRMIAQIAIFEEIYDSREFLEKYAPDYISESRNRKSGNKFKFIIKESSAKAEREQDNYYIKEISNNATKALKDGIRNDFSNWNDEAASNLKSVFKTINAYTYNDQSFARALKKNMRKICKYIKMQDPEIISPVARKWAQSKKKKGSIDEELREHLEEGEHMADKLVAIAVLRNKDYGYMPEMIAQIAIFEELYDSPGFIEKYAPGLVRGI